MEKYEDYLDKWLGGLESEIAEKIHGDERGHLL